MNPSISKVLGKILLLASFVACTATAQEIKPDPKWDYCSRDEDCVHIEYTCSQGVVNKKFASLADAYHAQRNATMNCISVAPDKEQDNIPYRVYCEAKRCKVRGRNPKGPGFS